MVRYGEFCGTSLSHRWPYVFAPMSMVEARAIGRIPPPPPKREDLSEMQRWFEQSYPEHENITWVFYGSIIAVSDAEIAFAFKIRWC